MNQNQIEMLKKIILVVILSFVFSQDLGTEWYNYKNEFGKYYANTYEETIA